jgi:hypothetical protein
VFVCVRVFLCLCTGRCLATSRSPAQEVLPTVKDLENRSETESFMEVGQSPNWGCSAKEKKIIWVCEFGDDRIILLLVYEIRCVVGGNVRL